MRDITILIAHPDDEVIFCWPVLQQAKRIICCSSDLNNPERAWCRDRKKALQEIGGMVGAEVVCLDYNSEFYKINAREGHLWTMAREVLKLIESADYIYTHNPWGEYGHMDHILVHQIARASGKKLVYSDMSVEAGWLPCTRWPLYPALVKSCINDVSFYEKCKAVYDRYNSWTWSKPPIIEARIYADS